MHCLVMCASALAGGLPVAAAAAAPRLASMVAVPRIAGMRDMGRATNLRVDIAVLLPYRHAADLKALLAAQSTPGNIWYRHYLTAPQFRNYFAPTIDSYNATVGDLRRAGFVIEPFANRSVVHASAGSAVAERYFSTQIDRVVASGQTNAYTNVTPATVPVRLGAAQVQGLNNLVHVKLPPRQRVAASVRPSSVEPLFGPDGGFGPLAISKSGDFPVEHGYSGRDSNVADLIDGRATDTDVAVFLKQFGLTRSGPRTTNIAVDGGCGVNCGDSLPATIDAEWTLGFAPGASYFIYELPYLGDTQIIDGLNSVVSDDAVNIVNISFEVSCEANGGDIALATEPLFAQGAAEGISFEVIAFGGANPCGFPIPTAPYPADLDTVAAVGGSNTVTDMSGMQIAQTAYAPSGGGTSLLIAEPAWQQQTPGIDPSGRNVPDVVVPTVVDGTGPSIYFGGAWQGGFLVINNAPFAGYLATVQQMYGYGTPLGNVAPLLYSAFNHLGYTDHGTSYFTDITLGCLGAVNGVPVCAKPGYDHPSGIGSISGGYAIAKLAGYGAIQPPR